MATAASAASAASGEMEDEKICRYCFDGEESGELISPCKCTGGNPLNPQLVLDKFSPQVRNGFIWIVCEDGRYCIKRLDNG